LAPLKSMP